MSRQAWLRSRVTRGGDPVDPVPVEAAVLDARADTMREMVRDHVSQLLHERAAANAPADEFIPDGEFDPLDEGNLLSDYQLRDIADELESLVETPNPDPAPLQAPPDDDVPGEVPQNGAGDAPNPEPQYQA